MMVDLSAAFDMVDYKSKLKGWIRRNMNPD